MMTFRTDPSDEIRGHQLVRTAGPRSLFGKLAQTVLRYTLAHHKWLARDLVDAAAPSPRAHSPFSQEEIPASLEDAAEIYGQPLQSPADLGLDDEDTLDVERHERNIRRRNMLGLVLAEVEAQVWPYLKDLPPGTPRPTLSPDAVQAFLRSFEAGYDFMQNIGAPYGTDEGAAETDASHSLLAHLIVQRVHINGKMMDLSEAVSLYQLMGSIDCADLIDEYLDPFDGSPPQGNIVVQCVVALMPETLPCSEETRRVLDRLHVHEVNIMAPDMLLRQTKTIFTCAGGAAVPNFAALQALPLPHTARFGQVVTLAGCVAEKPTVH